MKIISGGQTGADISALKVAKSFAIETGGYCPDNYMTENGPNIELKKYNLIPNGNYVKRSKLNVDNSDITLAFCLTQSVGTMKTIGYCKTKEWKVDESKYKPVLIINKNTYYKDIVNFIHKYYHDDLVINVCGNRESKYRGISKFVKILLSNVLEELLE